MEKVRLTIELTPEVQERLDFLQAATGALDLTEVFRKALSLYDLAINHTAQGGRVVFAGPEPGKEIDVDLA